MVSLCFPLVEISLEPGETKDYVFVLGYVEK